MTFITQHLVNEHIENNPNTFVFYRLGKIENEVASTLLKEYQAIIAGGYAISALNSSVPWGDIDFYFPNSELHDKAVEYVMKKTGHDPVTNSPYIGTSIRATTFSVGNTIFQLIKTTFGGIQEIFDSFDFTNSKVAITFDPILDTRCLSINFEKEVPELLASGKIKYRRQVNLSLQNESEKRDHAKSNLDRLEKYLSRFPNGMADLESREQILQQYAWNVKYCYKHPAYLTHLAKILSKATEDELVIFYPLGGAWKEAFDTKGKSIVGHRPY